MYACMVLLFFIQGGWCPLLIAVNDNDLDIIDLVLRSGRANINISNNDGKTALILAIENQNIEIINALLGEKAGVEALQPWEPANIEAQDVSFIGLLFAYYYCMRP